MGAVSRIPSAKAKVVGYGCTYGTMCAPTCPNHIRYLRRSGYLPRRNDKNMTYVHSRIRTKIRYDGVTLHLSVLERERDSADSGDGHI